MADPRNREVLLRQNACPCTYDLDENGEGCGAHPYCSKDCQLGDLHNFPGPHHMEDEGADTSDGMCCEGCGALMEFLPERKFPD